jgi:lysozyme
MPPYLNLALSLIEAFEGFSPIPYIDPTGTWTIGYGFTSLAGKPITLNTPPLDKASAAVELLSRLQHLNNQLDTQCFEPLSDHQRAACLSLAYNIGMGEFARSTLLRYLNDGAYGAAADQFGVFTYSKGLRLVGLVKRRAAERECFNTKD